MTFADIYGEVQTALKKGKASTKPLVKAMCNMVYLNEVLAADGLYPLFWLRMLYDSYKSVAPATITGVTQASPGVFTTGAHGHSVGNIVTLYDVSGMTELNARTFKINTVPSTTTFTLKDLEGTALDTSSFSAYTSGGSVVHRGVTLSSNIEQIVEAPEWHDEAALEGIDDETLIEESGRLWDSSTTRPERYQHRKRFVSDAEVNEIWWFPGADAAYNLRFWAEEIVAELSSDTDVPRIPTKFHRTIVAGAITRLADANAQVENAVVWPSIYTAGIAAIRAYNQRYYHKNKEKEKPYLL